MKNKRFIILMVFTFFFILSSLTLAATWYVKTDGSDPADCTGGDSWNNAFATIQKAIDCASDGDEIWVAKGTYTLSSTINVNKAVYIYGGFNGDETQRDQRDWQTNKTIVDGNDSVRCFYITKNATLDGFDITRGHKGIVNAGGVYIISSSVTITNCNIYNNNGDGLNNTESKTTITNCNIYNNTGDGLNNTESNTTITNCNIVNNAGRGIYISDSSPSITNTIVWGNVSDEIYNDNSNPTITYSDIEGGYSGTGNINEDPKFADPDNGDFHLQPDSPCIDAGTNTAPDIPSYDFEGDPRIIDGNGDGTATVDMGADEYKPQIKNVPTLTEYSTIILCLILATFALIRLKRIYI